MFSLKKLTVIETITSSIMFYTVLVSLAFISGAVAGPAIRTNTLIDIHKSPFSNSFSLLGKNLTSNSVGGSDPVACTCGIFLTGQFKKGSPEQPTGNAVLLNEIEQVYPCNPTGLKMCQSRCLDTIVKHLPNSASILCASIDRDIHKERAYLFIKNCSNKWVNTNLSAGREYCCKSGEYYKCPI